LLNGVAQSLCVAYLGQGDAGHTPQQNDGIQVPEPQTCDLVLQAVGRTPNGKKIADDKASAAFNARVIPSVAYTDPEVAWVGLTEDQAKAQGIKVKKGLLPWAASGRAIGAQVDQASKLPF
jgi:hypothetical protein